MGYLLHSGWAPQRRERGRIEFASRPVAPESETMGQRSRLSVDLFHIPLQGIRLPCHDEPWANVYGRTRGSSLRSDCPYHAWLRRKGSSLAARREPELDWLPGHDRSRAQVSRPTRASIRGQLRRPRLQCQQAWPSELPHRGQLAPADSILHLEPPTTPFGRARAVQILLRNHKQARTCGIETEVGNLAVAA